MAENQIVRDYEFYRKLSPGQYPEELKLAFKRITGMDLDLDHPRTFNEKIQWLKLYDSTPEKTRLADKYLVREWVKEKIGEEYLIPLLGVWDCFDDIDFSQLPNQFVLKTNHGCGWNAVVKEKALFDREAAKYNFDHWMKENFALHSFELHYGAIVPKIIAEQYIENNGEDLHDYKVFCFNGRADSILYMQERKKGVRKAFYDLQWNKLPYTNNKTPTVEEEIPKPKNLETMIALAEKLAAGFALVRVDFYVLNDGSLKFGEMTFTPASGICSWQPEEQNLIYGDKLVLPQRKFPLPTRSFAERGTEPLPADFQVREINIKVRLEKELQQTKRELEKESALLQQRTEQYEQLRGKYETVCGVKQQRDEQLHHLNAKLQQTYAEKSALNAKLQQTYAEKSELNARLQQTYQEKSERGVEIKRLRAQLRQVEQERQQLQRKLNALKKSRAYRLGRALTAPFRKKKK